MAKRHQAKLSDQGGEEEREIMCPDLEVIPLVGDPFLTRRRDCLRIFMLTYSEG